MSEGNKTITATMSAVETGSDFIAKPTEAHGYLLAAHGMLAGAIPLGKLDPVPPFALTLLCGHACEAALKAILVKSGISERELRNKPYGHNILILWQKSADTVKSLQNPQPSWVDSLARVYDSPFSLRYPLGLHGLALPNQQEMVRGTDTLVSLAQSFVNE